MYTCDEYIDLISGGADSELCELDAAKLHRHLETCESCRALYEFYRSLDCALKAMEEEPPARLEPGVMLSVKNEKKRGGLKNRFAFRSFTAVAAAIAVVILITSYKGVFIPNKNGESQTAGGTQPAPPPAAPQAAMSAAVPELALFGADMEESDNDIKLAEDGTGDSAMRLEIAEEPRVMATAAPAYGDDTLLFSASPESESVGEVYETALRDVLSEHSGEYSKAMLFYEKAPEGIDEARTFKTPGGTVCYVLPVEKFPETEELNNAGGIEFSVIDDDPALDAKASDFVIIRVDLY